MIYGLQEDFVQAVSKEMFKSGAVIQETTKVLLRGFCWKLKGYQNETDFIFKRMHSGSYLSSPPPTLLSSL